MVIMFNTNNIHVKKEELKALFFKKNLKISDDELFLDFYQFMEFALNKVCDQDFRNFMRKLKKKKIEKSIKDKDNLLKSKESKSKIKLTAHSKKSK